MQFKNNFLDDITFFVLKLDKLISDKELQSLNIESIKIKLGVKKSPVSIFSKEKHESNIYDISFTFLVLKFFIIKKYKESQD